MKLRNPKAILVTIVIAQFLCTSLWFAGNGVLDSLITNFNLPKSILGHLTTAIQFGFIAGTLVFSFLRIVDKYSPSHVFLFSAIAGALANLAIIYDGNILTSLVLLRFMTGFFLAGIYPVGMKIASDYYEKGLGKVLGFLVGALVVGTALPHLLRYIGAEVEWRTILIWISALAVTGGLVIGLFVGDGPYRKPGHSIDFAHLLGPFRLQNFRKAAFGYFGHMWELYAFWAFVPVILEFYQQAHAYSQFDISFWSFMTIGIGGIACVLNGYLSKRIGTSQAAKYALGVSGLCCVASPVLIQQGSLFLFLLFLMIWGMAVVADSPMFSALVAQEVAPELRGTALTFVICIGFTITIVSIQLLNWLSGVIEIQYLFLILVPGPVFGLLAMFDKKNRPLRVVK